MKLISHIKEAGPTLYLAPLLNTVLLLLVFFFLGSSFIVQSGVPVRVPASPSRLVGFDRADVITIASGPDGRLYHNGQELMLGALKQALETSKSSTKKAVIYADQQTPYGRVMEVSSTVMAAGFDVAFATTPDVEP